MTNIATNVAMTDGGGGAQPEVFDAPFATEKMRKIMDAKTDAKAIVDYINDVFSDAFKNDNSALLGGDIKGIWDAWNGFYDTFNTEFVQMINEINNEVSAMAGDMTALQDEVSGAVDTISQYSTPQ